ncbi:MAG: hypothetical protein KDM63_19755, partial [Verrucomicrobiae bacterium]|nr:hypothetical protein [Verrucomicrobiae bacterium]
MKFSTPLSAAAEPLPEGPAFLLPALVLAVILLPLAGALASHYHSLTNRRSAGLRAAGIAAGFGMASFLAAIGLGIAFAFAGPTDWVALASPWMAFGLRVDILTVVMLLLVSFLGAVVTRYARNYLAGDPGQARFSKWLGLTISAVLTLIASGNLVLFTLAWMATSLSLHKLLTFYPERRAGLLAARKKFLISRLGDLCLIGGLVLAWQCFGTWEFSAMFAAAESARESGEASSCLTSLAWLLVAAALLKSAQFPFHSWLPDTMETPTPVSALMHAGIINAGGFLVVRLSPLVVNAPAALNTLALTGAVTALFASVVMLTQTNVKRSLAYSTIAQMGFMMLQCGLGAFSLAILHLVAHSLYKAHAFLSSGSIIAMRRSAWTPVDRPAAHPGILLLALVSAVSATVAMGALFGVRLASDPGVVLLGAIFLMGLAYLFWNLWGTSHGLSLLGWGAAIGVSAAAAYFALHTGFDRLLADA